MQKLFFILLLFLCSRSFAQVSVKGYLSDFDYGTGMVESTYSGFGHKVTSVTLPSYESMKDSLRNAIIEGKSSFEEAFGYYLAWFRDYHLHDLCGVQDKFMSGPVDYSAIMEYRPSDMFCKVDDSSFLIRYTSCVWSSKRLRWIKKAIRAYHKSRCENLILDLRGNTGGADATSRGFIELLYDHDGFWDGLVIRNTPTSIAFFRKNMKGDKYWQKRLDECELSGKEYFTLFEPRTVHYKIVSSSPTKAAVIIDNKTASCAYANPWTATLPNSGYRFRVPLTYTSGLPENGIDSTGIVPDVVIDCQYPESLTDNIDDWVRWVATWLTTFPS